MQSAAISTSVFSRIFPEHNHWAHIELYNNNLPVYTTPNLGLNLSKDKYMNIQSRKHTDSGTEVHPSSVPQDCRELTMDYIQGIWSTKQGTPWIE